MPGPGLMRASSLHRSPLLLLVAALALLVALLAGEAVRAQAPGAPAPYQTQRMHLGFYLWWEESSGATGYDIQIRAQSGGSWGGWENVSFSGTSQPAIVTGRTHGTKYQWRIRATAGGQQGAWSTILGDSRDTRTASRFGTDKPNPPILREAAAGPGQVTLRWEAGPARSGVVVSGYRISYRWEDEHGVLRTETTGLLGAGLSSYALSGLSAGVRYDFWLHPLVGESIGAGSNVLQAVPQTGSGPAEQQGRCNHADSTPPGLSQITSVTPGDRGITVRWDSPTYGRQWSGRKDMITNFIVRVSATDGSYEDTGNVTAEFYEPASYAYPIAGLSPATEYRIEITARTITACYSGPSAIEVSTTQSGGQQGRPPEVLTRPAGNGERPQPEPEPTDRPDVVSRYDANGNGAIDIPEYIQARRDYAYGRISDAEWELILSAWLASAYGS